MSDISRDLLGWPHNLTHCGGCDQPFPEPVDQWDDYFTEVEDAGFLCASCARAEGLAGDTEGSNR